MNEQSVLIVDDDPMIRSLVSEILTDEGFVVESAANGAEALRITDDHRPGVILLDLDMPVINGPTFAQLIQERYADPAPIVVLSATPSAWRDIAGAPAVGFIAKPFELDELVQMIAALCPRAGGWDDGEATGRFSAVVHLPNVHSQVCH